MNFRENTRFFSVFEVIMRSFFAGLLVSFASIIYLNNKDLVGCIFFSAGLVVILNLKLLLFTEMIGFEKNFKNLSLALFGNLLGTMIFSFILKDSLQSTGVLKKIVLAKLSANFISVFFSSFICGVLIYTAIFSFKKRKDMLGVVMCISAFVLFGADHCIANSFFYFASGEFTIKAFLNIFTCVLGNFAGSIISSYACKYQKKNYVQKNCERANYQEESCQEKICKQENYKEKRGTTLI